MSEAHFVPNVQRDRPATVFVPRRARLRTRATRAGAILGAALMLEFLFSPLGVAVLNPATFELDGNATASASLAGDDWNDLSHAFATTGIIAEPAAVDTTYFTGGGSKDVNDISQWSYGGSSVPAKDEITNAYAASYMTGGQRSIYFGLDRFAVNGDGNVGFWFFKDNVRLGTGGHFIGNHVNGDVFITAAFTNGGAVGTVQIYEWQSGGLVGPVTAGAECPLTGALGNECGIVNKVATAAPWAYTPKSGTPGTFPISAFFEGGIDVSALESGVQCFSAFLAETRSSQTTSAQLKDFAFGNFDTCRAKIGIDPQSALNFLRSNHTLTINVSKDIGGGYVPAAGVTITAAITSGPGSFVGSNLCVTTAAGSCTVNITSSVPGTTIVSASATLILGGASFPVSTDGVAPNSGPAEKTWLVPLLGTSTFTLPSPDVLVIGDGVRDTARVEDEHGDPVPIGNVTFFLCGPDSGLCSANGTQVGSPVALNASGGAESAIVIPASVGSYCFRGEYSGANSSINDYSPSTDASPVECFRVDKANSTTVTGPSADRIVLGHSVSDHAVLTGVAGVGTPTGTVQFYLEDALLGTPKTLNGTGEANSDLVTPHAAGAYCFGADYSGDANYGASSDNSSGECFIVDPAASATVTTPSASSVVLGGSVHDDVTVTGLGAPFAIPTGTVQFYLDDALLGSAKALDSAGQASSDPVASAVGHHCFEAVYSGDANYTASNDSSLLTECFDVTQHGSTTTTSPTHSSLSLGGSVQDQATVTGGVAGVPITGSVSFYLCAVAVVPCTTGGDLVGGAAVTLVGGSAISAAVTPIGAGQYCFRGEYSGDGNYSASNDSSAAECFRVTVNFTTRTQGFWATHLSLSASVWASMSSADHQICTKDVADTAKLMGGFWSSISYKSDGHKRANPTDQARMQLAQQLLAAMLNVREFGANDGGLIAQAKAIMCTNDRAGILASAAALDAFNNSGDATPLAFNPGSADPQAAQAIANRAFWDNLP